MLSEIGRVDGLVVSRAIAQVSRGALMELDDPSKLTAQMTSEGWNGDLYEKIIHLKTGVLFEAACELGAISAGADGVNRQHCMRYGSFVGDAYQMADDVKEIQEHLLRGRIQPHQMAPLAPAILCFAAEALPYISPILSGRSLEISRPFSECLREVVDCIEREIQRRLALAIGEIQKVLGEKSDSWLGLKAPKELIAMFKLSP